MNFEKEFDKLYTLARRAFVQNKINEFLIYHQKMSQVFTLKVQNILDAKDKPDKEININVSDEHFKEIKSFNENMIELRKMSKEADEDASGSS
jgi:hypothetical protein